MCPIVRYIAKYEKSKYIFNWLHYCGKNVSHKHRRFRGEGIITTDDIVTFQIEHDVHLLRLRFIRGDGVANFGRRGGDTPILEISRVDGGR